MKPREQVFSVRVNERERELFDVAAEASGRAVSSYVRAAAKRVAREDLAEAGKSEDAEARAGKKRVRVG